MSSTRAIDRAIEAVGGIANLARACDVDHARVWNWFKRDKKVPAQFCAAIEAATSAKVTKSDLRPDCFRNGMDINYIKIAIQLIGTQAKLAKTIGTSQPQIAAWLKAQRAPEHWVIKIEKATGGVITRYQLRPDVYGCEKYPNTALPISLSELPDLLDKHD